MVAIGPIRIFFFLEKNQRTFSKYFEDRTARHPDFTEHGTSQVSGRWVAQVLINRITSTHGTNIFPRRLSVCGATCRPLNPPLFPSTCTKTPSKKRQLPVGVPVFGSHRSRPMLYHGRASRHLLVGCSFCWMPSPDQEVKESQKSTVLRKIISCTSRET